MNEKGFAATGILYTILVLFILLFAGILTMLYSRNNVLTKLQKDLKTEIQGGSTCSNMVGKVWTFDYTGSEQQFTAPCDGTYRIEAWGAQGYTIDEYYGGYGAYASGNYSGVKAEDVLYITVGQAGTGGTDTNYTSYSNGGTGGTTSANAYTGSGGGSSQVAKLTGLLSSFSSNKTNILIVAAGGGSASLAVDESWAGHGGHGGGITGMSGKSVIGSYTAGGGGTQSAGGTAGNSGLAGSFGLGANRNGNGSGGGAGFYGGGSSWGSGSGGGSSYIGNLSDGVMYCYSCTTSSVAATKTESTVDVSGTAISQYAKIGNGAVRITLISV